MPEIVYRSTGSSTSTTVIWFIVSVPVLSELIADVDPSVSTDTRSLTMAFSPASSFAPAERITCRTVGSAVGIAAIASAIAVMNRVSADCPRDRPEREHHDHRRQRGRADPQGQRVQLLGQRRLFLGGRRQHAGDLADLGVGAPSPSPASRRCRASPACS